MPVPEIFPEDVRRVLRLKNILLDVLEENEVYFLMNALTEGKATRD